MFNELSAKATIGYPEMPRQMTIRERLESQKKALEERLVNVNKALDLMDKNPSFEAVHDAVTKAGY